MDYVIGEHVQISMDVYQMTIAANLTKNSSPLMLNYLIQKVFTIFMLQTLLSLAFLIDYWEMNKFQPLIS
jgi:hypothetical protein